jgi:hypothetical protein
LIDLLVHTHDELKHARNSAKYAVTTYSCWGDLPESVFQSGVSSVTGLHFKQHLSKVACRWNRLLYNVSSQLDYVWFAVDLIEAHRPGQEFSCKDSRIRRLFREPNPKVAKVHREATGMVWTIVA